MALLEVKNLEVSFVSRLGTNKAVDGISFTVETGKITAIIGESGSGKSVACYSMLGLVPMPPGRIDGGRALFEGTDLLQLGEAELRKIRGRDIAMIFQDPMTSLNPVLRVGRQITEALEEHMGMTGGGAADRARELLDWVGIPDAGRRLNDYPHQFSGGMRQRAMIAMALACGPQLLIADEPTTALDVTIQLQITSLVRRLQEETGMGVIWITHDLGVVARLVKRVLVMYAGHIVEKGPVKELYGRPAHPYTRGLLGSLPRLDEGASERLTSVPGQPPDQLALPPGCPFAERCDFRTDRCVSDLPVLETVDDGHAVACWEWKKVISR